MQQKGRLLLACALPSIAEGAVAKPLVWCSQVSNQEASKRLMQHLRGGLVASTPAFPSTETPRVRYQTERPSIPDTRYLARDVFQREQCLRSDSGDPKRTLSCSKTRWKVRRKTRRPRHHRWPHKTARTLRIPQRHCGEHATVAESARSNAMAVILADHAPKQQFLAHTCSHQRRKVPRDCEAQGYCMPCGK